MLSALCLVAALAAAPTVAAPAETPEAALRAAELELNRAFMERDSARVDALLVDDWTLVVSSGAVHGKADVLAQIQDPAVVFETNEVTEVAVRVWGDTAVMLGVLHQVYTLHGAHKDVRVRYTDTWTRSGGRWRQAAGHATRLE